MIKTLMGTLAALMLMASPVYGHGWALDDSGFQRDMVELSKPRYTEVTMNVSAYTASSDECGKGDGVTASGVVAVEGITVASDDLPFGTVVVVNGHRYVVQDRFGGGYSNRLDIYMESVDAADNFGRQWITVMIEE